VCKPDDIGDAMAALLSDELAWMNAQRAGSLRRHVPVIILTTLNIVNV
jgi:hypothetical protein